MLPRRSAADQLALSYHASFEVPVTVLRPFNTYGPRQSTRAVTSTLLHQLLRGAREVELGRLDTRRDMTYVGDTVDGFIKAALAEGVEGATIQLGTGQAVSIGELFTMCCEAVGVQAEVRQDPRGGCVPMPVKCLVLESDPSIARERLGWEPQTLLVEGLRRMADWIRSQSTGRGDAFLHL